MDLVGPELNELFSAEEFNEIPTTALEKLKKYLEQLHEEYYKEKASASRVADYEKQVEQFQAQLEDSQLKLQNYDANVTELRKQLDTVSQERVRLLEMSNSYEKEISSIRLEKNSVAEDRDSLMKVIERQNSELDRLQQELRSYQQQLKNAIAAKCDAIARIDEIESKEVSVEFRERRMEQERTMFQNQVQALTDDLNRKVNELNNLRRDNTMRNIHLEARLEEKIEEIKIAQKQNSQYKETIDELNASTQELSNKLHIKNEEINKMMDFYKKELDAKTKLTELYKSNYDDTDIERNELNNVIADMKRMISEASEQYGELETKYKATLLKHEQESEEQNKTIETLKFEIQSANDLLKEVQQESVETTISKIAPSASIASRLIRTDMSLTQLYALYAKSSEECELQKRENSRLQLQLKSILQELNENAPLMKKQEIEYEKLIETHNILLQQREDLMNKNADMEEIMTTAHSKINFMERENKKLKHLQSDLSRQVCLLLKEIERNRTGGVVDDEQMPNDQLTKKFTMDDVISKKLVTFRNIPELQANNEKLLLLVRDLSEKLENAETLKLELETAAFKEKVNQYAEKIQSMQEMCNQQNSTIATVVHKCERYKKMYFNLQKQLNRSGTTVDISDDEGNDVDMKDVKKNTSTDRENSGQRIADLEKQIADCNDRYNRLKEQHEYYSKEKTNNERILNEQVDSMRAELRELTSTNCKVVSSLEYTKEQVKLQQKNISTYKNQISTLEDRNKNYETTIVKHEQTVQYLKDEIMKVQQSNAAFEAELTHLRQENRLLKDTISRLQTEKQGYYQQQQSQSLLMNNLEIIKSNLERSEVEGRARLEQRLEETVRELSAQRRRFQEDEDRFRETTNDLKRQTESAKQRMEEEKLQANKLRDELMRMREELKCKTAELDDLSKKLQESLTPSKNDNPIALANKKIRELEQNLAEAKMEISAVTASLHKQKEHADQYYKMSQSAETEIKNLHEMHTSFVARAEAEIKDLKMLEQNLKARISELETERKLESLATRAPTSNESDQLSKTTDELKDCLQKLNESHQNLNALRLENATLSETLSAVETKYANEMMMHSSDIQELTKLKEAFAKVQDKLNEQQVGSDEAKMAFESLKKAHDESLVMFENEKSEFENRIKDINNLNSSLHDQIEALTTKLNILSQTTTSNVSINESQMDTSTSELNRSVIEQDGRNYEQLLQIVKYLRREKDLIDAKLDIIKAENSRLVSENTMLQKKIDELQGFLNQERTKSQTAQVSASKHGEILRKIETLNAITDSNRILREERNTLTQRVKELTDHISSIEKELFPLQNQNRDLGLKVEELSTENTSLRSEAVKWRQRANVLVEKSNKNPEEFKRLQMERESLAKMLTADKENLRKLTEELETVKTEKLRLESEQAAFEKNNQTLNAEKKKLLDENSTLRQNNTRIIHEIMELKNNLLSKEEIVQKLQEDLVSKDLLLHDSKNKEIQIRKIAKRYKDSYLELSKASGSGTEGGQTSNENVDLANNANDAVGNNANTGDLEQYRNTIEELNTAINTTQSENDKLREEIGELRTAVSAAEDEIHLKKTISEELEKTKAKLQEVLNARENNDILVNNLRSQHEETVNRLTREIESLQMRVNQLNRQQQTSKPSTSSVVINEKGCISESSPRTANVKPMSGSASGQQSATVQPWRGSETPLASIRPITVQNTRTAAILPTSQQPNVGGTTTSSSSNSNTALVPPQQQVHTTGSTSAESMSSSPTSSHTDYMPSTSSTSVVVAAVPPMASTSAESSQEAESIQQQQSDSQIPLSGAQQQVVALVSPRVEGSSQCTTPSNTQTQQEPNNQQPSTSGSSGFTPHVSVSSHIRHTPSSSNVTTSQAGSSGAHKRPRDIEDNSPSTNDDCAPDMLKKHPKLVRIALNEDESVLQTGVTDSEIEYQVPTSSQRDQEDDIVVVDSDADDGMVEADDGPADGDAEHEGYEDSYEQDADVDETEGPEVNESNIRTDMEVDNNEVDVDECIQVQCTSDITSDPSTSQAASESIDNRQQSHTISSGSSETNANSTPTNTSPWMQASSSGSSLTRQQKAMLKKLKQGAEVKTEENEIKPTGDESNDDNIDVEEVFVPDDGDTETKSSKPSTCDDVNKTTEEPAASENLEVDDESEEDFSEEVVAGDNANERETKNHVAEVQQSQVDATSEDNEGIDAVSSEGEKQAVEELEEEGREAEASTSQTITTRSKSSKSAGRRARGYNRGSARPTPIVWQDGPGNSRNAMMNQRIQEQGNMRGFPNQRTQRGRRMRRPTGGNFANMRFP